jgi:hypothetical protein
MPLALFVLRQGADCQPLLRACRRGIGWILGTHISPKRGRRSGWRGKCEIIRRSAASQSSGCCGNIEPFTSHQLVHDSGIQRSRGVICVC